MKNRSVSGGSAPRPPFAESPLTPTRSSAPGRRRGDFRPPDHLVGYSPPQTSTSGAATGTRVVNNTVICEIPNP